MSIVYYFPKVRFSTDIDDRLIEAHAAAYNLNLGPKAQNQEK